MFGTCAGQVQLEAVTNEFNDTRGICTLLVWVEVVFVALWIFLGTRPNRVTNSPARVFFRILLTGGGSGLLLFEIKEEAAHAVQGVVLMEICCIYKGKHTVKSAVSDWSRWTVHPKGGCRGEGSAEIATSQAFA